MAAPHEHTHSERGNRLAELSNYLFEGAKGLTGKAIRALKHPSMRPVLFIGACALGGYGIGLEVALLDYLAWTAETGLKSPELLGEFQKIYGFGVGSAGFLTSSFLLVYEHASDRHGIAEHNGVRG